MNDDLSVTLLHALPGRIRVRLSEPPFDTGRFIEAIKFHDGMNEVSYSPVSRSLLITYGKGHLTTEEILLRSAIALSFEYRDRPVKVFAEPATHVMTDGAVLAGILLAGAAVIRWSASPKYHGIIDKTAGAGVALAVVEHGWREAREQGYIHPELLSLGYLVTSYFRDTLFRGAVITWIASFGRHLLSGEEQCIEVSPITRMDEGKKINSYQVKLGKNSKDKTPLLNVLKGVLDILGIASFAGGYENLFGELQNVATVHGKVLEGMGEQSQGIPIIFK